MTNENEATELENTAAVAGQVYALVRPEFTQGICSDGAAILMDGEKLTIKDILDRLIIGANSQRILNEAIKGNFQHIETTHAFQIIKKAMENDNPSVGGSYAHSWHCNIACMCADAIRADHTETLTSDDAHRIGNEAATRFMKLCFDVETKA